MKDLSSGEITFYVKGADVVMSGIVQYNDWLEEEVRYYSSWDTLKSKDAQKYEK